MRFKKLIYFIGFFKTNIYLRLFTILRSILFEAVLLLLKKIDKQLDVVHFIYFKFKSQRDYFCKFYEEQI